MPTNNFKLFDQNKANLLSDTEYANATQRLNGVQTGVASSQLNNKFAYQVSLVAYAIAQIMNQNGLDASDTLSVSAFVGNLGGALLQKVADKASSAEAAAGVLENKYISPATMKAAALLLSGGVMTGTLDMNNNKITNLPTPTSNSEPATKEYVDGNVGFEKIAEDSGSFSQTNSTGIAKPTNLLYSTFFEKLTQYLIRFHINGTIKFVDDQASANPLIMLFFSSNLSSDYGMAFNEGFTSKITKTVNLTKIYQYTSGKCYWNDGKTIYHFLSGLYDNSPYGTQLESSYLSLSSRDDSNDKLTISTSSDAHIRSTMNINYDIEIYRLKI